MSKPPPPNPGKNWSSLKSAALTSLISMISYA